MIFWLIHHVILWHITFLPRIKCGEWGTNKAVTDRTLLSRTPLLNNAVGTSTRLAIDCLSSRTLHESQAQG